MICRNASVLAFHLWPTIFAGAPFRLQNICRNGVPPRSRTTTPLQWGYDRRRQTVPCSGRIHGKTAVVTWRAPGRRNDENAIEAYTYAGAMVLNDMIAHRRQCRPLAHGAHASNTAFVRLQLARCNHRHHQQQQLCTTNTPTHCRTQFYVVFLKLLAIPTQGSHRPQTPPPVLPPGKLL